MITLAAPDAGTVTLFVAAVLVGLAAAGVAVRELWVAARTRPRPSPATPIDHPAPPRAADQEDR